MVGSANGDHLDGPPGYRAYCRADAGRRGYGPGRRPAARRGDGARPRLDTDARGAGRSPAAYRGGGRGAHLPAGRLALTVRYRAGPGPAFGDDAGSDSGVGPRRLRVPAGALGPGWRAFPPAVPVPAHGAERRLPDRRLVQPVRLLRGT